MGNKYRFTQWSNWFDAVAGTTKINIQYYDIFFKSTSDALNDAIFNFVRKAAICLEKYANISKCAI